MPNAGNCLATNIPIQAWHILRIVVPESRQQAGQTLCIVTVLSVQNNERWISTQGKWNELIIQGKPRWNQVSCLNHQLKRKKKVKVPRDAKRARGEPEQDLSVEIPIPGADDTLTTPEIPVLPSDAIPSSLAPIPISPGASSSSGVKRTYSESTALPNSLGVSSGSGVKRTHGESVVNDDEEQPGTRARISNLIAGLHGVDVAEDDEISSGDGVTDEWLSSWYRETHMSQKMVLEAKREEMDRFKRMKVYRVVTRESMEKDQKGTMISIKWVITNKSTEEHPIATKHVW